MNAKIFKKELVEGFENWNTKALFTLKVPKSRKK
jgi:hypothetical protein